MAGISSKALKPDYAENKYKFNGIEQNTDFDMNMYDAQYRNLDPQIGRFWQIDPKPVDSISPFAMMYNNPIRYNDPLGDTIVINLFTSSEKPVLNNAANTAVSKPTNDGVFLVFGHGNPYGIQGTTDYGLTQLYQNPSDFNAFLSEKSPEYKQALEDGLPIALTINACNTASEEYVADGVVHKKSDPIAEQISTTLPQGSTVTAPDGYLLFTMKDGKPTMLGVQATSEAQPQNTGNGGFVKYSNGQVISKTRMPFGSRAGTKK